VSRDRGERPRPCCMISEVLEEAGVDREQLRRVRRQVLEGLILLCQWQLARMNEARPASASARASSSRPSSSRRGRKITVE
jgi:hypothetical protein